jgi:hypothetical protein
MNVAEAIYVYKPYMFCSIQFFIHKIKENHSLTELSHVVIFVTEQ